jgi:hypothetical protein
MIKNKKLNNFFQQDVSLHTKQKRRYNRTKNNMMLTILIVLFGSNEDYLLQDRTNTAINYARKQDNATTIVHWLLSGGIKNPAESTVSEALKMSEVLNQENFYEKRKWTYIMDEDSTNTAENLMMVKAWVSNRKKKYDKVLLVTSAFHKPRASVIADEIFEGKIKYDWLLSQLEKPDSRYWEGIHIQNAKKDARDAKSKCTLVMLSKNRSV